MNVTEVNIENIEEFVEKEDKLVITFFIPLTETSMDLVKKSDMFECCENKLIIKTFGAIRQKITEKMGMSYIDDKLAILNEKCKDVNSGNFLTMITPKLGRRRVPGKD